MAVQKTFDELLIFANLYRHEKNQTISSIFPGDRVDLKILQFDWQRAFLTMPPEQVFSQKMRFVHEHRK